VGKGREHGADGAARDLFRGLLESAPDAVVIVDETGTVVLANRRVVPMLGYEPDELLGQPVEILLPERYREGHHALREGFLRDPGVRPMGAGRDLHAVRKDGTEVPVEIWLSTLATDDGVLVSAAVRDTSERRRLQREADLLRDELVATVSHELRTPLTSIIGYVELLADLEGDALSEEGRRMLGVIERNAHRELHLVNDLLDLGSIRATTVDVRHRVELAALVRATTEGGRVTARARGVDLAVDVPDGLEVLGDPQRLGQVLDNLVGNAVKFSSPGGTVRIAGGQDGPDGGDGGTVWLEVRDEGAGIPVEELPRIFDRLYRSSDAVRQQVPGAGLGLTIAQAIGEAHGGRIGATSRVGSGTTVRVVLPAPGASDDGQDA
jgi:protein-histidine pros-kinase